MLVLSRRVGEKIIIGDRNNPTAIISLEKIREGQVRIGIYAPGLTIDRHEIADRKAKENKHGKNTT